MKNNGKTFFIVFLICLALSFIFFISVKNTSTNFCNLVNIQDDLEQTIDEQLGQINGSGIDEILGELTENELNMFGEKSFIEKISAIIKGEYDLSIGSVINLIFGGIIDVLKQFMPLFCLIGCIAIVGNILSGIKGNTASDSIQAVIDIIIFSLIAIVMLYSVSQIAKITTNTIMKIKHIFDYVFPLLLTLMATIGSVVSVGLYKPLLAILSEGVVILFINILLPIFNINLVFNVVGNLSSNIKLNQFTKFFNTLFNYIVTFTFTIFTSLLTIFGIHAGSFDGISIRTAKFALKSYIPIVGGFVSDGLNLIVAGSILIKNSVGLTGLILLLSIILTPIITIILFKLCLQLLAGILEPVVDGRLSNLISGISKSTSMLLAVLVAVSFMYVIITGLIICSSNII